MSSPRIEEGPSSLPTGPSSPVPSSCQKGVNRRNDSEFNFFVRVKRSLGLVCRGPAQRRYSMGDIAFLRFVSVNNAHDLYWKLGQNLVRIQAIRK